MGDMERRVAQMDTVEIRVEEDGDTPNDLGFTGHAAVFNQKTLIGSRSWGFVEWIEPGAFRNVLDNDVRFVFNHDGLPLARTANETLRLSEDKTGLLVDADLADVTLSRDLATLVRRRDLTQMSFAFSMMDGGEQRTGYFDEDDPEWPGMPYRAITAFGGLYDVSPVTYPAYDGTDANMRALYVVEEHVRAVRATIDTEHKIDERDTLVSRRVAARRDLARAEILMINDSLLREG